VPTPERGPGQDRDEQQDDGITNEGETTMADGTVTLPTKALVAVSFFSAKLGQCREVSERAVHWGESRHDLAVLSWSADGAISATIHGDDDKALSLGAWCAAHGVDFDPAPPVPNGLGRGAAVRLIFESHSRYH
jgi:hypothetical protein